MVRVRFPSSAPSRNAKATASRRVTVATFTRSYETAKIREREQAIREGRLIPRRLIQAIRTSMGLDQSELAGELGVSMDTVRSWEVESSALS